MAPNTTSVPTGVLFENEEVSELQKQEVTKEKPEYVRRIVWLNVFVFLYLHLASLYGIYLAVISAKWMTIGFAILLYNMSALGITAGAHRLWSHKSYKAKWQLEVLLVIFNTIAHQNSAIEWVRDHRVHHKYSETNADPHNATRGFFFSHMGWLLCKKHPDVIEKGQQLDISDITNNPILAFQKKYFNLLMPLMNFILPTIIPVIFWDETWSNAFFVPTILRYVLTLNSTWLVNSAAHMFGNKPYDRHINPSQNVGVAIAALGEGWHNYHHVFPWDYKTAELGNYTFNFTTAFIDFFAWVGWAYDLKTVSEEMMRKRVERTGDGSHELWGWGDKDQTQEEKNQTIVIHPKDH